MSIFLIKKLEEFYMVQYSLRHIVINHCECDRHISPVFTLNFLPYKPTGPVSSNIYRPTINSTGLNLKTTLMTINSNHQNSKDDDVPNIMWACQLCIR